MVSIIFNCLSAVIGAITALIIIFGFRKLKKQQADSDGIIERRLNELEFNYKREIQDLSRDLQMLRDKHNALPCAKVSEVADEVENTIKEAIADALPTIKNIRAFMVSIKNTAELKAIVPNLPTTVLEALLAKTEHEQMYEAASVVSNELKTRQTQKSAK